jgi:hypothetical protein
MVLGGRVNKSLVTLIQQAGGRAVGLCGKDSDLILARQMVEKDIGFVGEVTSVRAELLEASAGPLFLPRAVWPWPRVVHALQGLPCFCAVCGRGCSTTSSMGRRVPTGRPGRSGLAGPQKRDRLRAKAQRLHCLGMNDCRGLVRRPQT